MDTRDLLSDGEESQAESEDPGDGSTWAHTGADGIRQCLTVETGRSVSGKSGSGRKSSKVTPTRA
eukprot:1584769-Rhodomonas_salina.1